MKPPYKHELKSRARELRKNSTRHENHLWYDFLNRYPIKFRRQRPIDGFIVDFFCEQANLVIELDGSQHFTEQGTVYDTERSVILGNYGLKVIRFTNSEIDNNFDGVCAIIDKEVKERIKG